MNDLEKQLATVVEKALQLAEQTGEFVIDQAPLLLQEFYTWHIIRCVYVMVICIIVFSVTIRIVKSIGSKSELREYGNICPKYFGRYYNIDNQFISGTILTIGIPTSIGFFIAYSYQLIFLLSAPKLYLIEYFIK